MKLIDADKARGMILRYFPECAPCTTVFDECAVRNPRLEVHAHWIHDAVEPVSSMCSRCKAVHCGKDSRYCGNCGARMDGDTE